MTLTGLPSPLALPREMPRRHYLMCPPTGIAVEYVLSPWMDRGRQPIRDQAVQQWAQIRDVLTGLGHVVHVLDPIDGLPDQTYVRDPAVAATGGHALTARWRHPERAGETGPVWAWLRRAGWHDWIVPRAHLEGGDVADAGDKGLLLGHGFRSQAAAAADLYALTGREVTTLRLVDPRFYHLDTALGVIDEGLAVYHPGAFDKPSRVTIARLWPDAVRVSRADALALGCNLISAGTPVARTVVMPLHAYRTADALRRRGVDVYGVDTSELAAAGGGPHCCILPLPAPPFAHTASPAFTPHGASAEERGPA